MGQLAAEVQCDIQLIRHSTVPPNSVQLQFGQGLPVESTCRARSGGKQSLWAVDSEAHFVEDQHLFLVGHAAGDLYGCVCFTVKT